MLPGGCRSSASSFSRRFAASFAGLGLLALLLAFLSQLRSGPPTAFQAGTAVEEDSSAPPPQPGALPAAPAAEEAPRGGGPHASERFFASIAVPRLRIEIASENIRKLRRNHREYVPCTVREGEVVYEDVAIHLKGAAGSFRPLEDKPALTLNFDRLKAGQKFHGIDKLHLNNSVQDASYLSEFICAEMFLAAGVPASRIAFARVWLNGRDLGFYVLKEGFDKSFLRRHFKNVQGSFYDGGFLQDVTDPLRKSSGPNPEDRSDLAALARAAGEEDEEARLAALEKVLDVDRFLSFCALESLTWHWDGYLMNRNNYRLYHDPESGRFVFFPHGMDQMFGDARGPLLPHANGYVAQALLQSMAMRKRYYQRCRELCEKVFRVETLVQRVGEAHRRIRSALVEMDAAEAARHDEEVRYLQARIRERARSLRDLIEEGEPEPLRFESGVAALPRGWREATQSGSVQLEMAPAVDDVPSLVLRSQGGECVASWRRGVLLERGRYRFEARARSAGVLGISDQKGAGAGIRISGSSVPRGNALTGDHAWRAIAYEFEVEDSLREVVLVCELRARRGAVWYDLGSLRLRRL
jgi:spore coat protein CotH